MPNADLDFPTIEETRARFLRDIELGLLDVGVQAPAVDEGSEYFILGTAIANMAAIIYAQLKNVEANTSELTATGKALDDIRVAVGLPEVSASPATGRIVPAISGSASVPFPDGLELTLDRNGYRAAVYGGQTVVPGGTVLVRMLDAGADGNAEAEETVTWSSPPNNVQTSAYVDADGLTGGTDVETDERKRQRILNRRRYVQGAGSWGHAIELAEAATGSVQKAYCYPALIGPSSAKVVVTKAMQLDRRKALDFSRELGETSLVYVRNEILANFPVGVEVSTQSAEDELFDCSVLLTLTDPQKGGFVNSTPWPPLVPADDGRVVVETVTATNIIQVSANTTTAPQVGQSVSWWSPSKREFLTAIITAVGGAWGAWQLTLDRPLVNGDSEVAAGDFISPAAHNAKAYGAAFLARCNLLGPGENTEQAHRLPRALRRPFRQDAFDSALSAQFLKDITAFSEVLDYEFGHRSLTSPTVPSDPGDAPNVLVPRHFGLYQI